MFFDGNLFSGFLIGLDGHDEHVDAAFADGVAVQCWVTQQWWQMTCCRCRFSSSII